jgi:hypothetical protein
MKSFLLICTIGIATATTSQAATCKQNFSFIGLPLLSQIEYRTFATVSGVSRDTALQRIADVLAREGYARVRIRRGSVTALQETSGSGRPQSISFAASASGNDVRIDAVFTIQQGQIAGERVVRNELCRLIATANG